MNKFYILILFLIAILFTCCEKKNQDQFVCCDELKKRLGDSLVSVIQDSTTVSVVEFMPNFAVKIPEKISERPLSAAEILQLKKFLLTQEHYLLNFKKKAVFIPSIGFRFSDNDDVWVIVSFSARQINFIHGEHKKNLDYDRMAESFESFCHQLVGRNHE